MLGGTGQMHRSVESFRRSNSGQLAAKKMEMKARAAEAVGMFCVFLCCACFTPHLFFYRVQHSKKN